MAVKTIPIALALFCLSSAAGAQELKTLAQDFKVEPTMVRSEDASTTTFGLAYEFQHRLAHHDLGSESEAEFDPREPVSSFEVSLDGSGLITASAKENPENFLATTFKAEGLYQSGAAGPGSRLWLFTGGVFGSLETDQSFDNQQTVLGVRATFATTGVVTRTKDDFGVELSFGEVEPADDLARKTALGVTTLKTYDRLSLEANYQVQTGIAFMPDIEFNYRWFRESKAPAAIKAAGLDKFDLFTVRVGLPVNLFVAYSDGKLPFDRQNDRTFKAGFSYELGKLGRLLEGFSED